MNQTFFNWLVEDYKKDLRNQSDRLLAAKPLRPSEAFLEEQNAILEERDRDER